MQKYIALSLLAVMFLASVAWTPSTQRWASELHENPNSSTLLNRYREILPEVEDRSEFLCAVALGYWYQGNISEYKATYRLLEKSVDSKFFTEWLANKTFSVECRECSGKGLKVSKCPNCKGVGKVQLIGGSASMCHICAGKKTLEVKCVQCGGQGSYIIREAVMYLFRQMLTIIALDKHNRDATWKDKMADLSNHLLQYNDRVYIMGKVLQKIESGLLVDSIRCTLTDYSANTVTDLIYAESPEKGIQRYCQTCLLRNHPKYAELVDNDRVQIIAYPDGQYAYESVMGAKKTIRAFKVDNLWGE